MINLKITSIICLQFFQIIFISCSSNMVLVGRINYDVNNIECTKMHCNCCNDCSSPVLFITDTDTFNLIGTVIDTGINCHHHEPALKTCDTIITTSKNRLLTCKGKECSELNCYPLSNVYTYTIKGHTTKNTEQLRHTPLKIINYRITPK